MNDDERRMPMIKIFILLWMGTASIAWAGKQSLVEMGIEAEPDLERPRSYTFKVPARLFNKKHSPLKKFVFHWNYLEQKCTLKKVTYDLKGLVLIDKGIPVHPKLGHLEQVDKTSEEIFSTPTPKSRFHESGRSQGL